MHKAEPMVHLWCMSGACLVHVLYTARDGEERRRGVAFLAGGVARAATAPAWASRFP
jgi:hypothetical protein